jgi:hypothetical protein
MTINTTQYNDYKQILYDQGNVMALPAEDTVVIIATTYDYNNILTKSVALAQWLSNNTNKKVQLHLASSISKYRQVVAEVKQTCNKVSTLIILTHGCDGKICLNKNESLTPSNMQKEDFNFVDKFGSIFVLSCCSGNNDHLTMNGVAYNISTLITDVNVFGGEGAVSYRLGTSSNKSLNSDYFCYYNDSYSSTKNPIIFFAIPLTQKMALTRCFMNGTNITTFFCEEHIIDGVTQFFVTKNSTNILLEEDIG